jgi:hypothetical protein
MFLSPMTVAFVVAISVVLGLLLFLIRELRRPLGPAQWGRTPRWGKRLRVTLDAIILLIGLLLFWGFLIEPNRLVVHRISGTAIPVAMCLKTIITCL